MGSFFSSTSKSSRNSYQTRNPAVTSSDKYVEIEFLGKGSFGSVHLCRTSTGRLFALKKITDRDGKPLPEGTVNTLATIFKEERIMKTLNHPNIVEFYDWDIKDGKLLVFLEYAEKGSLRQCYRTAQQPFNDFTAGKYTRDILKGLQYLHSRNIIHHDIKCDNVLLFNSGVVKLADFGIAGQLKGNQSLFSPAGGTKCFCAPEVLAEKRHNYSADVWSVGATVIEMKIANYPIQIEVNYPMDPLSYYRNSGISATVIDFVDCCLKLNPNDRASIEYLLNDDFIP